MPTFRNGTIRYVPMRYQEFNNPMHAQSIEACFMLHDGVSNSGAMSVRLPNQFLIEEEIDTSVPEPQLWSYTADGLWNDPFCLGMKLGELLDVKAIKKSWARYEELEDAWAKIQVENRYDDDEYAIALQDYSDSLSREDRENWVKWRSGGNASHAEWSIIRLAGF